MSSIDPDLVLPVVGAVVAGALVGLERQYRGSPAGFRTHVLVALASGLLMLSAVHQVRWLSDTPAEVIRIDPVRMAHGILTGIGFLGAGAIFRDGLTIRGLTTAASLWITSALGTLFGIGFYGLAIGGTVATVIVLAAVSVTEALLPQRAYVDVAVRYRRAAGVGEAEFRQTLAGFGLAPTVVSSSLDGEVVEFSATVGARKGLDTDRLSQGLLEDERAVGFRISASG